MMERASARTVWLHVREIVRPVRGRYLGAFAAVVASTLITLSGPAVRLLHQAPSLLKDANAALPSITRFSKAFKPAIEDVRMFANEADVVHEPYPVSWPDLFRPSTSLGPDT